MLHNVVVVYGELEWNFSGFKNKFSTLENMKNDQSSFEYMGLFLL
jgi:hypothetical protein